MDETKVLGIVKILVFFGTPLLLVVGQTWRQKRRDRKKAEAAEE